MPFPGGEHTPQKPKRRSHTDVRSHENTGQETSTHSKYAKLTRFLYSNPTSYKVSKRMTPLTVAGGMGNARTHTHRDARAAIDELRRETKTRRREYTERRHSWKTVVAA